MIHSNCEAVWRDNGSCKWATGRQLLILSPIKRAVRHFCAMEALRPTVTIGPHASQSQQLPLAFGHFGNGCLGHAESVRMSHDVAVHIIVNSTWNQTGESTGGLAIACEWWCWGNMTWGRVARLAVLRSKVQEKQILCYRPHRNLDRCKDRNRHFGTRLAPSKLCRFLHCNRRLFDTGLPARTACFQAEHARISKSLNRPGKRTFEPERGGVPSGNGSNCLERHCRWGSNPNIVALCELRLAGDALNRHVQRWRSAVARHAGTAPRSMWCSFALANEEHTGKRVARVRVLVDEVRGPWALQTKTTAVVTLQKNLAKKRKEWTSQPISTEGFEHSFHVCERHLVLLAVPLMGRHSASKLWWMTTTHSCGFSKECGEIGDRNRHFCKPETFDAVTFGRAYILNTSQLELTSSVSSSHAQKPFGTRQSRQRRGLPQKNSLLTFTSQVYCDTATWATRLREEGQRPAVQCGTLSGRGRSGLGTDQEPQCSAR